MEKALWEMTMDYELEDSIVPKPYSFGDNGIAVT